ncbi:uncharacterized protein ARB_02707 [Trichophyton benhamiae CBS 112371]|uniref:Uncharacterized protein n=1 Tax=Arthroderma benhamiae (strain ATCC MYA-4681 / CBS 112371) TaxID=663331 RepID=D4B2M4_ARTBC|nr:uncharacterized protein ARB_02707 [Trichophyton benhamiae CBS 112371]EFE30335.1 hypothetical protein ARB_02707 [Trichophyton benhamiae CBS 112371]
MPRFGTRRRRQEDGDEDEDEDEDEDKRNIKRGIEETEKTARDIGGWQGSGRQRR